MQTMLFCLEKCLKCEAVKPLAIKAGIPIVTLAYEGPEVWEADELELVKQYGVIDDLAPVLVLENGTKLVGQLRIMKWLQRNDTAQDYKKLQEV